MWYFTWARVSLYFSHIVFYYFLLIVSLLAGSCNSAIFDISDLEVTGFQWFWSSSSLQLNTCTDSNLGAICLLDTSSTLFVNTRTVWKLSITSTNVIHNFCIPGHGVKIDAVPGRISTILGRFQVQGLYYGQCSELCGSFHSFMSISISALN